MQDYFKNTSKVLSKQTLGCALMLSMLFAMPVAQANKKPKTVAVDIAKVTLQQVAPSTWLSGDLISLADARIATEVEGHLLDIAQVGDKIRKGEVLATINDTLLSLRLRDDQTNVKRLQAQLNYLSRQISRTEKLAKKNSTSQAELERLQMERDMNLQNLAAAEIQVERTRYLVEQSRIVAPFDGVVVDRLAQRGEYLSQGQDVVRFVNVDEKEITIRAPIHTHNNLAIGATVQLQSANSTTISLPKLGKIDRVIPVGNARSRMLEVRIKPESADWIIGEAVKVQLPSGAAEQLLTVPRDALVLRQKQIYVFTVDGEGKAKRVSVDLGASTGGYVAVKGTLQDGDSVIVRGAERVRPGQQVRTVL